MTPFADNIEKLTEDNPYFRKVLFTGKHAQLVVMKLQVGERLDEEVHPQIDQFFRIEEGKANFVLAGKSHRLGPGGAVVIPAGMKHEIINISDNEPLKVYTVYSPPNHPAGTLDETLADAKLREQAMKKTASGEEEEESSTPGKKVSREVLISFFKENPHPTDDQVHDLAEAHGTDPSTMESQIYGILGETLQKKASVNEFRLNAFFDELDKISAASSQQ
jgi:mannose-6-phosphate isomerase-like protein (cupin superfamily)